MGIQALKFKLTDKPLLYLAQLTTLAIVYAVMAKLGLSLAFAVEQVTTVWPPTGIALAALLIFGYRLWPGIFIGAFVSNLLTNEPAFVAGGIAIGNTLEALVGAYLLRRVVGIKSTLTSISDVMGLVVFAGLFSTMFSASIGTLSLAWGGLVGWSDYWSVWRTWWVGDMMGALIFAPVIMAYSSRKLLNRILSRPTRAVLLMALTFAASMFAFTVETNLPLHIPSIGYVVFPFAILAAFHFTHAGVASSTVIITATALWATLSGLGPFVNGGSLELNLIFLQVFIFVVSVTSMILAVTVEKNLQLQQSLQDRTAELKEANQRITNILAGVLDKEDPDLASATSRHNAIR